MYWGTGDYIWTIKSYRRENKGEKASYRGGIWGLRKEGERGRCWGVLGGVSGMVLGLRVGDGEGQGGG